MSASQEGKPAALRLMIFIMREEDTRTGSRLLTKARFPGFW